MTPRAHPHDLPARRRRRFAAAAGAGSRWPLLVVILTLVATGCGRGAVADGGDSSPAVGDGAARVTALDAAGRAVAVPGASDALDPSVAIGSGGRIHVAWAQRTAAGGDGDGAQHIYAAHSDDGGKTFSKPVRVTRAADANSFANTHVKLQPLDGGRILLTYPRFSEDDPTGALYSTRTSTSTDGGETWSAPVPLRTGAGFGAGETYQATAAAGDDVWTSVLTTPADAQDPASRTGLSVMHSLDGGATWDVPRFVDVRTCECCDTAIAADSKRRLFIGYRDQRTVDKGDPVREISVARSYDRGETWSDAVPVVRNGWRSAQCPEAGPELTVDSRDRLHVVFWRGDEGRQGVTYARSDDHGVKFRPVELAIDEFFPAAVVDVATDSSDAAWVTWDDARASKPRVWLARVDADRTLHRSKQALASGEHPAIDARGERVVVAWATPGGGIEVRVVD